MYTSCPRCQTTFEVRQFSWWPIILLFTGLLLILLVFGGFILLYLWEHAGIGAHAQADLTQRELQLHQAQRDAFRLRSQVESQRQEAEEHLQKATELLERYVGVLDEKQLADGEGLRKIRLELLNDMLRRQLSIMHSTARYGETPAGTLEGADDDPMGNSAMALLRQIVAAKGVTPQRLRTDPEYQPLRSRKDFQQLLLELENRAVPKSPSP